MVKGDGRAVQAHISHFKNRDLVRYDRILKIPSAERIPALVRSETGREYVAQALGNSLKSAFDNMNLRKGFNDDQLVELVGYIMEEASDDNLALEDVLMFLYQLVTGKAGRIYDRMDIPTFFELFEHYREQRFQAHKAIQYENHCNYKSLGDPGRTSEQLTENDAAYLSALKDYKIKHLHDEKDK